MTSAAEEARIVPEETPLTKPYWDAARRGRVGLQRCRTCAAAWHPPQPRCPSCQTGGPEWFEASGRGRVHSYTVVRHAVHRALTERVPYAVVLVELQEGPKVIFNLLDHPVDEIRIGMPVAVVSGPTPGGLVLTQAVPRREDDNDD